MAGGHVEHWGWVEQAGMVIEGEESALLGGTHTPHLAGESVVNMVCWRHGGHCSQRRVQVPWNAEMASTEMGMLTGGSES